MLRYQKGNSLKCSAQPQRVENMVEIEIHINSPAKIGLKSKFIAIEQQYLYICNNYRSKPHIYITLYIICNLTTLVNNSYHYMYYDLA